MEIKKVSVVGGGTMGNGIAHVFALKGFDVNLVDINEELVQKAIKTISSNLDRQVRKNVITEEDKSETINRIKPVTSIDNTPPDSDLII